MPSAPTRISKANRVAQVSKQFFEPLRWLSNGPFGGVTNPFRASSDILASAVEYNCRSLVEYSFLTAERHKSLKELLRQSDPSEQGVVELVNDMMEFLNKRLFNAATYNFDILKQHFMVHTGTSPRICLKGNFPVDHLDNVILVLRDSTVDYNSNVDIERNTGFRAVRDSGAPYFENDIPKAVVEGRYVNPRLDYDRINKRISKGGLSITDSVSDSWHIYWHGNNNKRDDSSFYKSTMIIPLRLAPSHISEEFSERIKIKDIDRLIFGYLCLDQTEINYFDKGRDFSVVEAIADMLTSYFVHRVIYTDASQTFRRAFSSNVEVSSNWELQTDSVDSSGRKPYRSRTKLAPIDTALRQKLKPTLPD